ncbi:hypothetical protein Tco_0971404 [Tanacetum coccineum]
MTTSSTNNSVFRGFFEKQKLTGPNFIDWYRQLRIVLSIDDKLNYLEQPLPPAPVAPAGQHVAPEILAAHTAWVKGSKEIAGLMLMTMEPEIQRNLENLHANDMLKELKTLFAQQAEQELLQTTRDFHACKQEEGQHPVDHVALLYCLDSYRSTQAFDAAKTVNGEVQLQALVDRKKIIITESIVRRDLQLEDAEGVDCLPNSTIFEQLTVMGSKRKDTEVPQPSGPTTNVADEAVNEDMDDILATPNEAGSQGTTLGGGPRRQDTIGDIIAQTRFENVSKTSNDSLLAGVNTPQSDEDRLNVTPPKYQSIMVAEGVVYEVWARTNEHELLVLNQVRDAPFSDKKVAMVHLGLLGHAHVLDLENTKTAQAQEITSLKLRVKKLENKGGSRTHKLKRLYKVGRSARVIFSDEASLGDQEDASKQRRKIDDIDKDPEITLVDETQGRYGQDMAEKEINVAEKEVSIADPVTTASEVVTTASVEISTASPTETTITDDLTLAQTLIEIRNKGKAIMEEPEKPTKRKDQIRHDEEVAQRLQAQLQAELKEEDRLVRHREEEANIVSWDNVQAIIDADYQMAQQMQVEEQEKLKLVEGSEKRTREELMQESAKKQKVDDDKETAELKNLMEVVIPLV